MKSSDSSSSSVSSDSDEFLTESNLEAAESIIFYIMCLDPSLWHGLNDKSKKRKKIDRQSALDFIDSWDDIMFKRQFRVVRADFAEMLEKMKLGYPGPLPNGIDNYNVSIDMGNRSFGQHIPLELKLCISLRLLAGASYLDMVWYRVSIAAVHVMFEFCVDLLYLVDNNISLPLDEAGYKEMADGWSRKSIKKWGVDLMQQTILAGIKFFIYIIRIN